MSDGKPSGRKRGAAPGQRFGGRKKGTPNKSPEGPGKKPKFTKKDVKEMFMPANYAGQDGEGKDITVRTDPGGPFDPRYSGIEDPVDLLMAIVSDDRLALNYRMAAAKEVLPYVRSRMAVAPYRPPDHDGRIFIEVVKFSKEDFERPPGAS